MQCRMRSGENPAGGGCTEAAAELGGGRSGRGACEPEGAGSKADERHRDKARQERPADEVDKLRRQAGPKPAIGPDRVVVDFIR